MKRIIVGFSMIVCLVALLFACKKDNEPDKEETPYFAIDAKFSVQTFGPEGGTVYVTVNTNQTIAVTSSASWCSAELTPNTTDSITIRAEQLNNPATRTATVTIACSGFNNAVVAVTQTGAPATLSVTPLQPEILSPEGGEVVITVAANAEWDYRVVETDGWLTEKAKTDTTLTLTVASNGAKSKRTSDVVVFLTSYPDQKQEITVSQEAAWESTLNVMTFNIRVASGGDGTNNWTYRRTVVTKVIVENGIDIVGTQETEPSQQSYLTTNLPTYHNVGVGRDNGSKNGEYNSIFFKKGRFDILDNGTFWLSETPNVPGSKSWSSGYVRIATWAKLKDKATGKELFVINTHIDHISKAAQEKQVEVLLQKIEELHGDLPVILTGDFNMSPDNSNIIAITNASFSHTRDVAESKSGKDYTYHGFNETPVAGSYFADYIFTSSVGVRVYQHSVLPEKLDDVYLSEHTPVMAKIGIE
jgi:endonuclease/exonuclease/phosphatase family metal-dependent hydrolase